MRVSIKKPPRKAAPPFKSPRAIGGQRLKDLRAFMERWQMQGANRGTQMPSKLAVDEFSYSTPIVTVPAGMGSRVDTIMEIESDAFFDISKRQIWLSGTASSVMVEMQDVASDRQLLQPTPSQSFAGDASLPFDYMQIKQLSPTQRLRFILRRNDAGVAAIQCQITFTGRKVFIRDY